MVRQKRGRPEENLHNLKASNLKLRAEDSMPLPRCRLSLTDGARARRFGRRRMGVLLVVCGLAGAAPAGARAQAAIAGASTHAAAPEQEVIYEALASYGNYNVLAGGTDCKLYTAGVEYDRHSWGRLLGGELDYAAEALPVIVLNEPQKANIYGTPIDPKKRQLLYGIGFSPIGWRLQWRNETRIKPYLEMKGGLLVFNKKALSSAAAYENFTLQYGLGTQVRLTPRVGLRLGLFTDFHFSDGFVVPANPGLDVMTANLGISYHLGVR